MPQNKIRCQCPNHNCNNYATGNHYINMTVPVCRECFIEAIEEEVYNGRT